MALLTIDSHEAALQKPGCRSLMNKPEMTVDRKIILRGHEVETSEEPNSERETILIPDSRISGQKEFQIVSLKHESNNTGVREVHY